MLLFGPEKIPVSPPLSGLLHEIFEAQAASHPGDVAVVFGGQETTYGQLDARANQVARYLRRRGVGRGAFVAMLLPRSVEAYAAILGILKAGGAYVPIDPEYPVERIAWIVEDSAAAAVIATADFEQIGRENTEALPCEAEPGDLCYLIYTSGSTGRPKGVMVEHRNACHLVMEENCIFGVRGADRVFQGPSLSFDLSVEEMWLAFAAGATLVAATPEMAQAGPDLSWWLAELGVTVLSCVPTLLSMLDAESLDLPSLRLLILGGEKCPNQLVERWARRGRRIVNTYGPTETTVIATYADLSPGKRVTIGRAVPGYRVSLLDDQLRPVAPGQTGEICIAGAGVARGYRGLATETSARFVPDPFEHDDSRMYRSGDLGRIDSEGNIEFMGRADGQVKLRGQRVELGEIESALLRDGSVQAAACSVRDGASGDMQLIAWVVAKGEAPVNEECLRADLRKWLPAWMVPSQIETVGELPLLASGKLDRAALVAMTPQSQTRPRAKSVPASATERKLMEVWTALLQPLPVSVDDDFFLDLGGHSLLAAWMVSELRKDARFASLTVRDVYSYPSISLLAAAMDARTRPSAEGSGKAAERDGQGTRHFFAGAIQSLSLYFIFAIRGVQWIAPWLIYFLLVRHHSVLDSAAWALAGAIAILPFILSVAISAKWVLLGRVRPGRYPLWGKYYLRWWFVQSLIQSVPLDRLGGTPLLPLIYRLLGVWIGKDVHVATDNLAAFDVISIGDGSSIDEGASLVGYTVEDGNLIIGPISLGCGCMVGTASIVSPGTVMEDGARL
jgi:amino acid adenylation domain-containing protein